MKYLDKQKKEKKGGLFFRTILGIISVAVCSDFYLLTAHALGMQPLMKMKEGMEA
ncbi:MAG: hypothetical protein H5T98_00650 [Syntrophomonadaceae bacterium]|nr:hypothetical protein [Syntrophomonadaceae bacterium]